MIPVILSLILSSPAFCQKAVMENVPSSRYAIKVDTTAGRVDIATTSYTGGVANTGLFVASNVVVGTLANKNACVIYATGAVSCLGVNLSTITAGSFVLKAGDTMTGPLVINSPTGSINVSTQALASGATAQFGSGGGTIIGTNIQVINNQNSTNAGIATHNSGNVETAIFAESGGTGSVGTTSNHPLKFLTNNTEVARFTATGALNLPNAVNLSSTAVLAPGGAIILNPAGGNTLNNSGGFAVYATSIDGASQSSGCAVVVNMNGTTGALTETFQFTSTITVSIALASTQKISGVLLQTCAPGASCLVGIAGIYRVFAANVISNQLGTSATRCQVGSNVSFTDSLFGYSLESNGGASAIWVKLDK